MRREILKYVVRIGPLAGIFLLVFLGGGHYESTYDSNTVKLLESFREHSTQLAKTLEARDRTIADLKGKMRVASLKVEKTEQSLMALRQSMPTGEQIVENVTRATITDKGLRHETHRILGDLGITHIVLHP